MRFIEPNRLIATGMSKPVGRSNSSAGPPPGDFETRSVTAAISRSGLTGSVDPRQHRARVVERGDEFVEVVEHVSQWFMGFMNHPDSLHLLRDSGRERQRRGGRPRRPRAAAAVAHRADEVGELPPQRLVLLHRQWARPRISGRCAVAADEPPAFDFLRGVVDRDVGVRLEEADLPDPITADAAGGQVGDAARRKPQPRVGDVELRRQHRHADRLDRR